MAVTGCPIYLTIIICFFVTLTSVKAARILAVFPTPSISHQVVFRPLIQELLKNGHEVVLITPDPAYTKGQTPQNLTEIDCHDASYKIWRKLVTDSDTRDLTIQYKNYLRISREVFKLHMETKEIQDLINSRQTFDLLLVEACIRTALGYSHIYKVPVIQVSSFGTIPGNLEAIGAPNHPILYGNTVRQRISNLTIWEKINEIYRFYLYEYINYNHEYEENKLFANVFGPNAPTIDELRNNVHMLFLNMHPVFEGTKAVPPSVVYMGGLHQKPIKKLPTGLKKYLDSSKHGVIYISFGTNVNTAVLPPEKIQVLVKVLSKLPYDVLWKWDGDELPRRTENIKIAKWLPQSDLLRHPKIKLFVTQGGLQSTDESLAAGVPLIGVPLLGDQWFNVEKYVDHKIGVRIDLESVTEDTFSNAINTVIGDESYRRNVVKLHTLIYDQPQPPLERAIWWIEHVIRHGGAKHLRSPAANISWREFLELDLVSVLLVTVIFVITSIVMLCRCFSKGSKVKRQ